MANARAFVPTEMPSIELWYGNLVSETSDEIIISDGFRKVIYSGSFSYDFFGNVAGKLFSVEEYRGETKIYSITEINADAAEVYEAVQIRGDVLLADQIIFNGEDSLIGSSGADFARSFAGDDELDGRGGDDALDGGKGNDTILGGDGYDTYIFEGAWGEDIIIDQDQSGKLSFIDRVISELTFRNDSGDLLIESGPNQVRFINYYAKDLAYNFLFADSLGDDWSISPENAVVDEAAGNTVFTVARPDPSREATYYVSAVQDEGATNDDDYGDASTPGAYSGLVKKEISLAAGEATATVELSINDDVEIEGPEAFRLIVQEDSSDAGDVFVTSTKFTIADNDMPTGSPPEVSGESSVELDIAGTDDGITRITGPDLVEVSDADGDVTVIRFHDATPGSDGGTLTLDGVAISDSFVDVTPEGLDRVAYEAGPSEGVNEITVEAFDAEASASEELTITITVAATETPVEVAPVEAGLVYLSTSTGALYTWNADTDALDLVGNTGVALTDVAAAPDGTLFGISQTRLFRIDADTAEATPVGPLAGELFFGTDALTDAQGFDVGPDGVGRISSGNMSVVAFVDLETGAVSNPFGPSLRTGQTSSGDLWFADDDRYFVTTNSGVLVTIAPSPFGERIADDDFIANRDIEGLVSLAGLEDDQRADLIGLSGNRYFWLDEGALPPLPGFELGTLPVSGSITGAARLRSGTAPSNEPPSLNVSKTLSVLADETFVFDVNATDDIDTEGAGLVYSLAGGADRTSMNIDEITGELRFNKAPDTFAQRDANRDGVYDIRVRVTDSDGNAVQQDTSVTVLYPDEFIRILRQFSYVNGYNDGVSLAPNGGKLSDVQRKQVENELFFVYSKSESARLTLEKIVNQDWSVKLGASTNGSNYKGALEVISIDFKDASSFYFGMDGTRQSYDLWQVIVHELQHLLDDLESLLDDTGIFSSMPEVERLDGAKNDEWREFFANLDSDHLGSAVRATNLVREELGVVERGSYYSELTNAAPETIDIVERWSGMLAGDFDQVIPFLLSDNQPGKPENFVSGGSNDYIIAMNQTNRVETGGGDDAILLISGSSGDELLGGVGNDTYIHALFSGTSTIFDEGGEDDKLLVQDAIDFDKTRRVGDDLHLATKSGAVIEVKSHYSNNGRDYGTGYIDRMEYSFEFSGDSLISIPLQFAPLSQIPDSPAYRLGSDDSDVILTGIGADIIRTGDGADTIAGDLKAHTGDTVEDFSVDDRLLFVDTLFSQKALTVTLGSAILEVDVDLDGETDATVTLEGDYRLDAFFVGEADGGTAIGYAGNSEPVGGAEELQTDQDDTLIVASATLLDNDTDADGDTLTVTGVSNAVNGTVSLDDKGDADASNDEVIFTPKSGFSGAASFDYTIADGFGGDDTVTVSVNVTEAPNAPPGVAAITAGFGEDQTGRTVNLLEPALVFDPDGDDLAVEAVVVTTADGRVLSTTTDPETGLFSLDDGQFENLAAGAPFDVTITYDVTDGLASVANTATVAITGANDAPVAGDDGGVGFETDADSDFTTASVLGNDTDVDGDTLTVAGLDTTGTRGLVTDNGDGTFDYDPNGSFDGLGAGDVATDTFAYLVTDGVEITRGEVTIAIAGEDDRDPSLNPVIGTPGRDNLFGTDGSDLIQPLGGFNDIAAGRSGADTFDFAALLTNDSRDYVTVTDYEIGTDSVTGISAANIAREMTFNGRLYLQLETDNDVIQFAGLENLDEIAFA